MLNIKILLITNMYPTEEKPSFGIFVKNIADFLKNQKNIRLQTVSPKGKNKIIKYINFYIESFKAIKSNSWDVIYVHYYTHSVFPVFIHKLINKNNKYKLLVHIHGGDLIPENIISRILIKIMYLFQSVVDYFIVPSNYSANVLKEKYKIPKKKIFIYPSGGVDTNLFRPIDKYECRRKLGIKENEFIIGFVSRLDKGKGWDIFLDALSMLSKEKIKFKSIVVGDGKEKLLFLNKLSNLNLQNKVVYLGVKPHYELPIIYNSMDLFVFPTLLKESLGLVGLEAMACGVPVIGSRIGGLKDYIEEGKNGFFFKPGDSKDLYRKISQFYNLPQEIKRKIRNNALSTAKNFSSEKVNKELLNFILEVCLQ